MSYLEPKVFAARDLLAAYLDLRCQSGEFENWTEVKLSEAPATLTRLLRLKSLFRAFGIEWKPAEFADGRLIRLDHPRTEAKVAELLDLIPVGRNPNDSKRPWKLSLQGAFGMLLGYREQIERVLVYNRGVSAASGLYLAALTITDNLNEKIRNDCRDIERILATLIDPDGREYSRSLLVKDYGFPEVDLIDVDVDGF